VLREQALKSSAIRFSPQEHARILPHRQYELTPNPRKPVFVTIILPAKYESRLKILLKKLRVGSLPRTHSLATYRRFIAAFVFSLIHSTRSPEDSQSN
jgi:hypothetical protein